MISYQEYFKPKADGLYFYTCKIDNFIQGRLWHIQCVVKETGGPIDKFKIDKFQYQLIKPENARPCEKVMSVEESSQIRDLVIELVSQLAKGERSPNRFTKAKVIWPKAYSQPL